MLPPVPNGLSLASNVRPDHGDALSDVYVPVDSVPVGHLENHRRGLFDDRSPAGADPSCERRLGGLRLRL